MSRSLNDKFDIRKYKNTLREKYKEFRFELSMEEKFRLDDKIFCKFTSLDSYKNADIILTYISTPIEVDTRKIVEKALADGKVVAAPKCVAGTRDMIFYEIKSYAELKSGAFSVLEPEANPENEVDFASYKNAVCVVPALAYDLSGFRLGYGKGYYDRFLSNHKNLHKIGLEYSECVVKKLEHGKYDVSSDVIVTEKYVKTVHK